MSQSQHNDKLHLLTTPQGRLGRTRGKLYVRDPVADSVLGTRSEHGVIMDVDDLFSAFGDEPAAAPKASSSAEGTSRTEHSFSPPASKGCYVAPPYPLARATASAHIHTKAHTHTHTRMLLAAVELGQAPW